MKKLTYILSFFAAALLVFAGCRKVDPLPYYNEGSKVNVTVSRTAVAPTPADSTTNVLTVSWTSPNYGTDPATYKFIVEIDSANGTFAEPFRREVIGRTETSFTGRDLNALLLNYGYRTGVATAMNIRVVSSYSNNNERQVSNPVRVTVTAYTDPSVLTTTTTTVTGSLNTASQTAATFNWTRSFVGYTGDITYSIQYDSAGKNFASPGEIAVGNNTLTRALTQAEINAAALSEGVAAGSAGRIEFRIKATTAQGALAFSNAVAITVNTYQPLVRLYMPGSYQGSTGNGTDWTPENAPELIRDTRPEALNKLYYTYIFLPAGAKFKFTQGRSWDVNYGGSNGNLERNGPDFGVTNAGWYRISVDLANMKYDIREGRMGFVGGATGADWNPGNTFPNYAMGAVGTNLFLGVTDFTTGGWKMIDHNDWNNGDISATNARSYGSNGPSGSSLIPNGPNMPDITAAGRYRVIWDGRDPNNVKYEISPASEMRVVGNGITGVAEWNPGASPQMTYQGNGIWTITLALDGNKEIKFLAGNNWGAFDYEDASGGSQAVGTARKIRWEGGDNFKTPAVAGTYTITLNEHAQTVTISQ
jgi:starch-binding outer membrane protein SusE/F